jgi:hypothetical protein
MVTKDIGLLRSKDSEGEKNSSLKQQLNSLLYLRKVIDHRIHRLQSEDTDSFGVPSQVRSPTSASADFLSGEDNIFQRDGGCAACI